VFQFSVLVFHKTRAPLRHPAFFAPPQAIYLILVGSHRDPHRQSRLRLRCYWCPVRHSHTCHAPSGSAALAGASHAYTDRRPRALLLSLPRALPELLIMIWDGAGNAFDASAAPPRRSGDPATNPQSGTREPLNSLPPSLGPSAQRLRRAGERPGLRRVSVTVPRSRPILGSNAECAFPQSPPFRS
jgi:hypothetical protein